MSKDNTSSKNNNKDKKNTTKKAVTNKNTDMKSKANNKENKNEWKKKDIEEVVTEEELYYDEDLDDFYDEDEDAEEIEEVKNVSSMENKKKENKKQDKNEDNIRKIEKMAKKNNKSNKGNKSDKVSEIGYFLDDSRNVILAFIIGVVLTVIIAYIIWPSRIATLKNGEQAVVKVDGKTYTADILYKQMKDHYSVSQLLDKIDNDILTKMYPETDEMKKEVESTAENYINMYKQYYNYTEEQFLSANGFASRDDYLNYLKLDNRRKKYERDYVEDSLSDKEIEEYYNDNVYGDIKCEHVLVEVASDDDSSTDKSNKSNKLKDEDAKKLAEEIIDKINDGTSWKDIQKEYKDKVTYENLGYQAWDSDLETSFKDALKNMDNKSYSTEPIKTSYGYHVIYRDSQKKTPTLKKTKSKIIEKLVDKKIEEDSNLLYKSLISLRNDKKIKFSDTDMKKKYDAYVKQYNK